MGDYAFNRFVILLLIFMAGLAMIISLINWELEWTTVYGLALVGIFLIKRKLGVKFRKR